MKKSHSFTPFNKKLITLFNVPTSFSSVMKTIQGREERRKEGRENRKIARRGGRGEGENTSMHNTLA
jgi:hypothetical protein